jgi:hypothetical protein
MVVINYNISLKYDIFCSNISETCFFIIVTSLKSCVRRNHDVADESLCYKVGTAHSDAMTIMARCPTPSCKSIILGEVLLERQNSEGESRWSLSLGNSIGIVCWNPFVIYGRGEDNDFVASPRSRRKSSATG